MGETIEIERQVTVVRVTTPILSGVQDVSIDLGSSFNPREGVSATDETDGDLTSTIQISGTVNSSEAGTYTLTYRVTNSQGQTEQVIRRITVSTSVRYTVTFNSLGGSNVPSQQIEDGARLVLPQIAKSGHTLLGWYISFNNGETFDERWNFNSNTVSNDLTLYARWQKITYNINLNTQGGDFLAPISQIYDNQIDSLPIPNREGHTFEGWYKDIEHTKKLELPYKFKENTEIFAKWIVNLYSISFETSGGPEIDSIQAEYGSTIELQIPSRLGHTFEGWYLESELMNIVNTIQISSFDQTLYAKWMLNTYSIEFETNTNIQVPNLEFKFGEPINFEINLPSSDNFFYTNWYLDPEFIEKFDYTTMPNKNLKLYLRWVSIGDYGRNLDNAFHLELGEVAGLSCGNRCIFTWVARYSLEADIKYRFNRDFDTVQIYKRNKDNFTLIKELSGLENSNSSSGRDFMVDEPGYVYIKATKSFTNVIRFTPVIIEVFLEKSISIE
jgi:uncharacterized repeat protein (TIGR02543 family)